MPTSRSIDPSDCLVTSLIQKAVQCGEKVALSTIHESVTYAELLDRVSALAEALPTTSNRSDGIPPIAVVVDRSIASVVAIMAVRWAGLPVLPIADSDHPENSKDVFGIAISLASLATLAMIPTLILLCIVGWKIPRDTFIG